MSVAKSGSKKALVAQRISDSNISCTSMVVSVFGDVVSQHGGWIWLGSLIEALEPFGFSERLVRTAVYRLVQSDWLKVNKVGRCSYYCFTETAKGHYEKAARRIYAAGPVQWDGVWTLVAPLSLPEEKRENFRKSLLWQGFNTLVPGIFAHPSTDRTSLDETLYEQRLTGEVVVMSARTDDTYSQQTLKALVQDRWNLAELEALYQNFLDFYRPLCQQITEKTPQPRESFLLRTLLIHDYRRVLLRDPDFPDAMLPHGWVGQEAYDLVKKLYRVLAKPSINYIGHNLKNAQGDLPSPGVQFFKRFGGLQ